MSGNIPAPPDNDSPFSPHVQEVIADQWKISKDLREDINQKIKNMYWSVGGFWLCLVLILGDVLPNWRNLLTSLSFNPGKDSPYLSFYFKILSSRNILDMPENFLKVWGMLTVLALGIGCLFYIQLWIQMTKVSSSLINMKRFSQIVLENKRSSVNVWILIEDNEKIFSDYKEISNKFYNYRIVFVLILLVIISAFALSEKFYVVPLELFSIALFAFSGIVGRDVYKNLDSISNKFPRIVASIACALEIPLFVFLCGDSYFYFNIQNSEVTKTILFIILGIFILISVLNGLVLRYSKKGQALKLTKVWTSICAGCLVITFLGTGFFFLKISFQELAKPASSALSSPALSGVIPAKALPVKP